MAKPLEKIIAFPGQVFNFPNPNVQLCGNCQGEIDRTKHDFITCGETGKWYCDMGCLLSGVDARISDSEHFVWFNACPEAYSVEGFMEEMKAGWYEHDPA